MSNHTSFTATYQDTIIWALLADTHNGFFLDVGSRHAVFDSLTKNLYDHGWHGINLVQPENSDIFIASRLRDLTISTPGALDEALPSSGSLDLLVFDASKESPGSAIEKVIRDHKPKLVCIRYPEQPGLASGFLKGLKYHLVFSELFAEFWASGAEIKPVDAKTALNLIEHSVTFPPSNGRPMDDHKKLLWPESKTPDKVPSPRERLKVYGREVRAAVEDSFVESILRNKRQNLSKQFAGIPESSYQSLSDIRRALRRISPPVSPRIFSQRASLRLFYKANGLITRRKKG